MIKKITAIVTAAACAGVMITLEPGFAPDVAAGASQPVDQSVPTVARVNQSIEVITPSAADTRNALDRNIRDGSLDHNGCAQGWPYYDQFCLSDSRQANGKARAVRIIAIDRSAAIRTER
jgi:hypothetical protein